jgi:membrane-associated protein
MPVVRTFAPILAGVGEMKYRVFAFYNVIGGALWAFGLTYAGYYLGKVIPNADHYIIPIVLLIIVASIAPTAIHILRDKKQRTRIFTFIREKVLKRNKKT